MMIMRVLALLDAILQSVLIVRGRKAQELTFLVPRVLFWLRLANLDR